MKVTNLTDKATPTLVQRGLSGVSIQVGDHSLRPGETIDVRLSAAERSALDRYVVCKALHVGEPPAGYPRNKEEPVAAPVVAAPPPPPEEPEFTELEPEEVLELEEEKPDEPFKTKRKRRR